MTTNAQKLADSPFAQTMANLKGRWADEKEHEDFNEYIQTLKNQLPEGFELTKLTKAFVATVQAGPQTLEAKLNRDRFVVQIVQAKTAPKPEAKVQAPKTKAEPKPKTERKSTAKTYNYTGQPLAANLKGVYGVMIRAMVREFGGVKQFTKAELAALLDAEKASKMPGLKNVAWYLPQAKADGYIREVL